MREIKFRAWNKENKKMYSDNDKQFGFQIRCDGKWCFADFGCQCVYVTNENGILMQYIGLKDKNGKEIYEGDICDNGDFEPDALAYNYRIEEVKYNEEEASFSGWNFNEDGMTCEVIGNIYEDPELLSAN